MLAPTLDGQGLSATRQRSADNHHWHTWEEMPPLKAAKGQGGPEALLGWEAGDTNALASEEAPEEG